jgi:hypothetical protein
MQKMDFESSLNKVITFDTKDELLYNWIRSMIIKDNKLWLDSGNRAIEVNLLSAELNYCFWKYGQDKSKAIGTFMSGGGGVNYLQNKYRSISQELEHATPAKRSLDSNGNLTESTTPDVISLFHSTQQWQKPLAVFYYPATGDLTGDTSTMHRNGSYDPVLPMAILLGGEQAVSTISEDVFPRMDNFTAQMQAKISTYFK